VECCLSSGIVSEEEELTLMQHTGCNSLFNPQNEVQEFMVI